jgi:3-deoxy-D-manno-octulosonate 8-phosphate phosphatase (KDO 8-P phosphatase)
VSTAGENALGGIRFVAFDVDGVFTDGRFYLSDQGVETKAFCTQDGYGVRCLIEDGCVVAVISGRSSGAVEHRMAELGVEHVIQGCRDKVQAFHDLIDRLGISAETCLFVGDDIPDLPLLRQVGYSVAVANAVAEVRDACDYTTNAGGGAGAVREVCDLVLAARREDRRD